VVRPTPLVPLLPPPRPGPRGGKAKRAFDLAFASLALLLFAPLLALAALAIRAASPGPVFIRLPRVGHRGRVFGLLKLRTTHVIDPPGGSDSAPGVPRVFRLGALVRASQLDELPQLLNVIRGDMSVVGPRPEDPETVQRHYTLAQRRALRVRPGLISPGTIYLFTREAALLAANHPERAYAEWLLPAKRRFECTYPRRAGLRYDLALTWRAIRAMVVAGLVGRPFPDPAAQPAARHTARPAPERVGVAAARLDPAPARSPAWRPAAR
jgi:lipopolysaccharide/colanic/teichoic acid biosynthesis glycosyltransferase